MNAQQAMLPVLLGRLIECEKRKNRALIERDPAAIETQSGLEDALLAAVARRMDQEPALVREPGVAPRLRELRVLHEVNRSLLEELRIVSENWFAAGERSAGYDKRGQQKRTAARLTLVV